MQELKHLIKLGSIIISWIIIEEYDLINKRQIIKKGKIILNNISKIIGKDILKMN